jgi:HEPN domain-containing protein
VGFLSQPAVEKALKAGLFVASLSAPKIHGLQQLLGCYREGDAPLVDADDLDVLDPWVIDGRYAADLPGLSAGEASHLLVTATRVVDAIAAHRPAPRPGA